ncbi:MAG: WG repeat-containing protein [Bacteroidota bacterium]
MKRIFFTLTIAIMITSLYAQVNRFKKIEKNTINGTKYGVSDTKVNKEIIPPIYDKIGDCSGGMFTIVDDNKKCGMIDTNSKVIIPIQYYSISDNVDGRIFISNGEKWAMADDKGKILTKFLYDEVLSFQYGVARVTIDNKTGYINSLGETILPCKFEKGYDCFGNFILIYSSTWESLGYNIVTRDFQGNVINVQDVGMSGTRPALFNKKGKMIYKGVSNEKITFSPSLQIAIVDNEHCSMVLDTTGKVIIPYEKEYSLTYKDDWFLIISLGNPAYRYEYGIMDINGKILLKPNFSSISRYTYNYGQLAKVTFENGGYFYIDKNVKCVEFDNQKCPE